MLSVERVFSKGGTLDDALDNYQERQGQIDMAVAVHRAFQDQRHAIIEAECGTGKTLAYLVPAANQLGKRTIVSTGTKALQEQLYYKDLPIIKKYIRHGLRVVYLKGRSNYLCLHRFNNARQHSLFDSREYIRDFDILHTWVPKTETGDVGELEDISEYSNAWKEVCCTAETCLMHRCEYFDQCFLMKLKKEANRSHIVVVNHHLFFADLMMRQKQGSFSNRSVLPSYHIIIFDEAHMIEDVASYYLSQTYSTRNILLFGRRAKATIYEYLHKHHHVKEECLKDIQQIINFTAHVFSHFQDKRGRFRIESCLNWDDIVCDGRILIEMLSQLRDRFKKYKKYNDDFIALTEDLTPLIDQLSFILDRDNEDYVYWGEMTSKSSSIHASPIDMSDFFRDGIFSKNRRVVLCSATLTSNRTFEYIRSRIGLDDADEYIIDSPFDFQKQGLLYIPNDLSLPSSKTFHAKMAERIVEILEKTKGRAFCLFTSYRNMMYVYEYLLHLELPYKVYKQGDMSRQHLIQVFSQDISSVLLATNTYWQGIDVPGESLSCVIIDKLPFAVPTDPIVYSRCKKVEKEGGNAFYDYQLPSSIIAIRQGAGRLIRTVEDKGLLAILDKRIDTKGYGRQFIESLPPFKRIYNLSDIVIDS